MLTTTIEIIKPCNYIIAATSMMFLSIGLTEVFKETITVEHNICYNYGHNMTAEFITYDQRLER